MSETTAPPMAKPAPLFELDLGANGGLLAPTTLQELSGWLQVEQSFWSWIHQRGYGNHDQGIKQALSQLTNAGNHLSQAQQYKDSNPQHYVQLIDGAKGSVQEVFVRGRLPHSSTPLAKRVDDFRRSEGDHAASFFASVFVHPPQGHHFQPQDLNGWRGLIEGVVDRYGLVGAPGKSRKQAAEQSFEQLRGKIEGLFGEKSSAYEALHRDYDALAGTIKSTATTQQTQFEAAQATRNDDFQQTLDDYKGQLEQLRKTFREEMALRAPAEYWETKRSEHNKRTWWTGASPSFIARG